MSADQDKFKKSGEEQSGGVNMDTPQYDPGFASSETAARKEREGESFGNTDAPGATVDKEGVSNVYPIEAEPYAEQPGDLGQGGSAARAQDLREVQQGDEEGKLSGGRDTRGKGPGAI